MELATKENLYELIDSLLTKVGDLHPTHLDFTEDYPSYLLVMEVADDYREIGINVYFKYRNLIDNPKEMNIRIL